jgi:hypothetical protein
MRLEADVFADLENLCTSPGFAHVLAYFCHRDFTISYGQQLEPHDFNHHFSGKALIRTELATLIGLLAKKPLQIGLPQADSMQEMIDRADALLAEIHEVLAAPMRVSLPDSDAGHPNPAGVVGSIIREPIFYSGENAYEFQFRELAATRYKYDSAWLIKNKGFSIEDARGIAAAAHKILNKQLNQWQIYARQTHPDLWDWLPIYTFNVGTLASEAALPVDTTLEVIHAFACECGEAASVQFTSVSEFNLTNARPFLKLSDSDFLLFSAYSLSEAIFDSPFYWMNEDRCYRDQAMRNRGRFSEEFSSGRLTSVFGSKRVIENVTIQSGNDVLGEVDVLVVFANRAIVVQNKSKRLTVEARRGNDNAIKSDFAKGVQKAYEQGVGCARLIKEGKHRLLKQDGTEVKLSIPVTDLFLFCVVSDSYPALSFQARQMLEIGEPIEGVSSPFVMDIFLLDVLCEILCRPLYFLSYLSSRARIADNIFATHEIAVLGFYLKAGFPADNSLVMLQDDVAIDLDIAITAKRMGLPGPKVPPGLLIALGDTRVDRLFADIEVLEDPASVDFASLLLSRGVGAVQDFCRAYARMFAPDPPNKGRDITIGMQENGITVHVNGDTDQEAYSRLFAHCELRKYTMKVRTWYGLCVSFITGELRFAVKLDFPWIASAEMDETAALLPMNKAYRSLEAAHGASKAKRKIGRNDSCPCGSGRKYKKCCLVRG